MKILTVGDIVSKPGCTHLAELLPSLKAELGADAVIVNGENAAVGNGILPQNAHQILACGADLITLGNHSLKRREIYELLEQRQYPIIRPANYHPSAPGRGIGYIDKGRIIIGVINLQGMAFMSPIRNPFDTVDDLIEEAKENGAKIILIDFHAEATAEKKAMGYYVDGKISAVFGTHTHVQTSDNQILPKGTGYITDIGMTGSYYSVLGVDPASSIQWLKTGLPTRFINADEPCVLEGCLFEIDEKSGKTVKTQLIRR